ncbi:MAG: TFIIB-type zinc ribbon-containing protein, partial [Haloglomus sp.]
MKIRGQRECKDCGTRWAYYDTGSVECPSCGSLRSVGVEDDRTLHTASPRSLDLTPAREKLEDGEPLRRVAETAAELAREFTRGYGFIDAGELQPLSDRYLSAMELRHAGSELARSRSIDEDEEYYLLSLLQGDVADRPAPEVVPESLRAARGLAYANAAEEYRADCRDYLDENPDPMAGDALESLATHCKRMQALDGDVAPDDAEVLVMAARDLWRYVVEDDETALLNAEDRLDGLA